MLFPDGLDQLPRLTTARDQSFTLNTLALGYVGSGQLSRAVPMFGRAEAIDEEQGDYHNLSITMSNRSSVLRELGALHDAEVNARRVLLITREQEARFQEAACLQWMGLALGARGVIGDAEAALQRGLRFFVAKDAPSEGVASAFRAQAALWVGDHAAAYRLAERAWELAHVHRNETDFILAARLQGAAALGLGDLATAHERLHHALTRARAVSHAEEELPALIALAELRRRQGDLKGAGELLDDAREGLERGPYPLIHADAHNVLAWIERDANDHVAAVAAATAAYRLAWCDGPPFAYHWGLEQARAHLAALGAPEPDDLPPFDEAAHEPMVEVEIDPADDPIG
jgi:ATP/maltotriose-dependent transcriptional regulator MalT